MLNSKTIIFSLQLSAFSLFLGCQTAPKPAGSSGVARAASTNQTVRLAWDKSPDATVTGYKLYTGSASRSYTNLINVGTNLTGTASNVIAGRTYYFAATAYNSVGLESDFSNEVSYTVPTVPPPPGNLRLTFQMQSSGSPLGPFTNVTGASVTITNQVNPINPGQYYRVAITSTVLE